MLRASLEREPTATSSTCPRVSRRRCSGRSQSTPRSLARASTTVNRFRRSTRWDKPVAIFIADDFAGAVLMVGEIWRALNAIPAAAQPDPYLRRQDPSDIEPPH